MLAITDEEYSRFRALADKISSKILPVKLLSLSINEFIDIKLIAEANIQIDIWNPESSASHEIWRFINYHTGEQFVVFED